jgi:hypothetical protein
MTTAPRGRTRALRTLTAALGLAGAVLSPLGHAQVPTARAQTHPACTFVLGFAALRDRLPAAVGVCLEDQQTNVANGDAFQRTSGGMLVWRKADNWTAFTDGHRTWVNGPRGLQERLNTQRYAWEGDASAPGTTLLVDAPASPQAPPAVPAPPVVPAPPAAAAAQGLRIVSVTSPARRNSNATLAAQTAPGAACAITIHYKSGPSEAAGLGTKTADARGAVSWTWRVGGNTTFGEWPIEVTCTAGGQRLTARTSFNVG